jgi:hypothetical protein
MTDDYRGHNEASIADWQKVLEEVAVGEEDVEARLFAYFGEEKARGLLWLLHRVSEDATARERERLTHAADQSWHAGYAEGSSTDMERRCDCKRRRWEERERIVELLRELSRGYAKRKGNDAPALQVDVACATLEWAADCIEGREDTP